MNPQQSVTIMLKNKYSQLSEVDKKIADFVLNNTSKVTEMPIAALANELDIAASGIIRLCKSLGLSGFAELKRNLLKSMYTGGETGVLPQSSPNDSVEQTFTKVFSSSIHTLQDTLNMIDINNMNTAVDLLANANSIHFFGVGTSATIAQDAYYRFMRIGFPAHSEVDGHIMSIAASQLKEKDVAVAISHCGITKDTVEALIIAKQHGASTIAITSQADSAICRYADIPIVVYSDEIRYTIEAVSARIAHIAVLDALCVALSLKNPTMTSQAVTKMKDIFDGKSIKQ